MYKIVLLSILTIMAEAQSTFDVQGHRGARGLMPENTILAFKRAIDEGVNTLEMDVIISKDKKVVVSHDPFFHPEISTKPDGSFFEKIEDSNLYLLSYSEIKKIDVGLKGHSGFPKQEKVAAFKPLLSEVIKEVADYLKLKNLPPINYNIELKSLENEYNKSQPEVIEFCELVLKQTSKIDAKHLTLQSFDFNILKQLNIINKKSRKPCFFISVLIEPSENNEIDFNLENLGFIPDIWSPYFLQVTESRLKLLHDKGIKLIPWTVNKVVDMQKMKELGCDGLITDYPDRARILGKN